MISAFMSPLIVEQISESDWRLYRPFMYDSEHLDRSIVIPDGFVTDFASVPRLPVAYLLFGNTTVKPAVIHDYLYRSRSVPRAAADAVFKEAARLTGQPAWRVQTMYAAVRVFGGGAYDGGGNPVDSGFGNHLALHRTPPPRLPRNLVSAPANRYLSKKERQLPLKELK